MFRNVLIFLLLAAVAVVAFRWLKRPRPLFEIRVGDQDVEVLGPVPNRSQSELSEYLRGLRLPVGARIVGRSSGKDFRLTFSASIRRDDRDRIRSYIRER